MRLVSVSGPRGQAMDQPGGNVTPIAHAGRLEPRRSGIIWPIWRTHLDPFASRNLNRFHYPKYIQSYFFLYSSFSAMVRSVNPSIQDWSGRWELRPSLTIAVLLNALLCGIVGRAAWMSSPTFDELAHFASGIALARYSDPGHFRVNPPTNKWLTAVAEPFMPALEIPKLVDSAYFGNSSRSEFSVGDSVYAMNPDHFHQALVTARLFRLPMLLLGSCLLWISCSRFPTGVRLVVQALWCTSPLMLGHGWIVSADAPAGVAMCAILWSTSRWIESRSWSNWILSGATWGIAIGTKFTFAPLYVGFVVSVELIYTLGRVRSKNPTLASWAHFGRASWACVAGLACRWICHALVACLTLQALYLFQKPLVPIGKHDFISQELRAFTSQQAVGWQKVVASTPSPFPKLFLEGIDQQLADMNAPRGAYLMGERIPGKLPWFFLVAFWIKEQPIVMIGLVAGLAMSAFRSLRKRSVTNAPSCEVSNSQTSLGTKSDWRLADSFFLFCFLTIASVVVLFTTQENLVWNMRYLILVLPPLYVVTGVGMASTLDMCRSMTAKRILITLFGLFLLADLSTKWHSPFSYANPFFGGNYRLPMALNDSNFDYGQDLYHVHRWIESEKNLNRIANDLPIAAVLSGHARNWHAEERRIAALEDINLAIANARSGKSRNPSSEEVTWRPLIVSRGLAHAEPWAVRYSDWSMIYSGPNQERLNELCMKEPVAWITPTLVVYDCSNRRRDKP